MSSFYALHGHTRGGQGHPHDSYGFEQKNGHNQSQHLGQHHGRGQGQGILPSYNNNYEQRFQSMQYGSTQKTNGMSMAAQYSQSVQQQPVGVNVFEVRFKCTKGDYLLTDSLRVKPGDFVKVEADRGYDIGIIFKKKAMSAGMDVPRKRILGHIGSEEMSILPLKISEETQAVMICRQMAAQRGLMITIADVEFQFDRNKLTVIFASEGRVDFRELVRDMFSFFRIRIWMQKVSPSEAMTLMELAAADGGGGGGGDNSGQSKSPSVLESQQCQSPSLSQGSGSGSGLPTRSIKRDDSNSSKESGGKNSIFSESDSPPPPGSGNSSLRQSPPPPLNLNPSRSSPLYRPQDEEQDQEYPLDYSLHHHQQQQQQQTDRNLLNHASNFYKHKPQQHQGYETYSMSAADIDMYSNHNHSFQPQHGLSSYPPSSSPPLTKDFSGTGLGYGGDFLSVSPQDASAAPQSYFPE